MKRAYLNTPCYEIEIDSKIEYSPYSLRWTPPEYFRLLTVSKHAHDTLNLAPNVVMLAEQCVPSMLQS